ncbi:helix-turn-helix domain-containing protein [Xylella fastidiosa]|uniref:Helix-turn-helix domain-containing protein n=1 Tax=Xylella fastidiosa TaxID=2371 RepID=A0ABD7BYM4_XYLFS|nr:helix-turn-helix domain-containing protein [Xylella fastidiosa]
MSQSKPIARAVEVLGSQKALADLLGIHPALVSQWVTSRRRVAPRYVLTIESATSISRHDLRPDIFGAAPTDHRPEASNAAA